METSPIVLDRTKARELWRDYRKHQHYSAPIDQDVMRTYKAIAQGRVVIKALDSICQAGLNKLNQPKLAIVRADSPWCWCEYRTNGSMTFAMTQDILWRGNDRTNARRRIVLPAGSFPTLPRGQTLKAITPQIPLPLRPKRALASYHILFEAEWSLAPPVDPLLLRRVGKADLWVVCAAWELTTVEQAALAARLHS